MIFSNELSISVIDKNDLFPLQDANVIIVDKNGNQSGGSTDINGKILLDNIGTGKYSINISYIGYENYKQNIIIDSTQKYEIICYLITESILIPQLQIISNFNEFYNSLTGSANILGYRKIKDVSPIGTQEILEHIPGVHAFSDDGIGNSRISIGIRGLNPRRSSRVLILEDGIPIQPALYVYPNMYYNPPIERIDGIQVIKGSGTVKFGPQTMGGIVNYYTSRPSNVLNSNFKLTIGNNGYNSLFTELDGFGSRKRRNTIQILAKKGDGYRDNNGFEQLNGTFKSTINFSKNKNIYIKLGSNYENSNATYTGLTDYSYDLDPNFNPKDDDNFKIYRYSLDLIETQKINDNTVRTRKFFGSIFDRKWWRETDILVSESNPTEEIEDCKFYNYNYINDIIRIGNGRTNFGILREFYVLGLEQSYNLKHQFFNNPSKSEYGFRFYWERFLDNKKIGNAPDARDGITHWIDKNENEIAEEGEYVDINGNGVMDLADNKTCTIDESIPGQSHNYETTAFSGFISNQIKQNSITINSGVRFELFEQERIDLLNGATYLDKTTFVLLPSISFIKHFDSFNLFGGIHRGFTSPSSGALKVTNFALNSGLDLKAEKSWNKEIGIRTKNLFQIADIDFSFFHVDIEDLVAAGRGTAFKNLGKVESMGTELSMKLEFKSYPFLPILNITHTYLKTKIKSGLLDKYYFMGTGDPLDLSIASNGEPNSLPYSPENTLLFGLEKMYFENLYLRIDYKYVGKAYTDFHNITKNDVDKIYSLSSGLGIMGPLDSYSTINTSISYNISSKIKLTFIAKNLLDEVFIGSRLHSNPNQSQANISSGIIPGPRRQFNLSINYSF